MNAIASFYAILVGICMIGTGAKFAGLFVLTSVLAAADLLRYEYY